MSDDQNNSNEQPAEAMLVVSPGTILSEARNAKNLSLEHVAKELFMAVSKLQALEQDQFDQFNSPIFVRGYLRSYAKLLKIDGDQVVAAFDQMLSARAPKMAAAEMRSIPENPQKQLWIFVAIIAGIFFVIYMISIWFFDNGKTSQMKSLNVTDSTLAPSIDNLPAPEPVVAVVASSSSSASPSITSSTPSTVSVAPTISSAKAESSKMLASSSAQNVASAHNLAVVASSRASIASQISAPVVQNSNLAQSSKPSATALTNALTKNQRLDEISFSFREESWLEVSDSRGDVLATELQSAGSHLSLTGVAPFDVKLGNSPGVDVKINGKKIPITPLITTKVLILKVVN